MILAQSITDDIRRLHDIWVARLAFEYRCERDDVLAVIQPRPAPQAPVASAPAAAPAVAPAEDVAPRSSATPLPETATPLQKAAGATIQSDQPDARPEALPEISGKPEATPSPEPQPTSTPAVQAQAVERSSKVLDGPSPSLLGAARAADPAPPKPLTKDRIKALHAEHPEFHAEQAAQHLDVVKGTLDSASFKMGIKWAKKPKAITTTPAKKPEADPKADTTEAFDARLITLHQAEPSLIRPRLAERLGVTPSKVNAAVARLGLDVPHARASDDQPYSSPAEAIPPATPQTPVGPPPPPTAPTLKERIRVRYLQYPNWTARMIATDLGANPNSVSAMLATVRREEAGGAAEPEALPVADGVTGLPNVTAGAEERALKNSYADVRKRLGAPR